MTFADELRELAAIFRDAESPEEAEKQAAKWLDAFGNNVWNEGWYTGREDAKER